MLFAICCNWLIRRWAILQEELEGWRHLVTFVSFVAFLVSHGGTELSEGSRRCRGGGRIRKVAVPGRLRLPRVLRQGLLMKQASSLPLACTLLGERLGFHSDGRSALMHNIEFLFWS